MDIVSQQNKTQVLSASLGAARFAQDDIAMGEAFGAGVISTVRLSWPQAA
jgi:hypothetical protein